jgi:hypothetical protein
MRQHDTRRQKPSILQAAIVNTSGYGVAGAMVQQVHVPLHRRISAGHVAMYWTRFDINLKVVRTMRRSDCSNLVFYVDTRAVISLCTTRPGSSYWRQVAEEYKESQLDGRRSHPYPSTTPTTTLRPYKHVSASLQNHTLHHALQGLRPRHPRRRRFCSTNFLRRTLDLGRHRLQQRLQRSDRY